MPIFIVYIGILNTHIIPTIYYFGFNRIEEKKSMT